MGGGGGGGGGVGGERGATILQLLSSEYDILVILHNYSGQDCRDPKGSAPLHLYRLDSLTGGIPIHNAYTTGLQYTMIDTRPTHKDADTFTAITRGQYCVHYGYPGLT